VPDNQPVLAKPPEQDKHTAEPAAVRVSLIDVPETLRPRRDRLSWLIGGGSLVVAALSVVVAIFALNLQSQGNRNAQAAVTTADAYKVSISGGSGARFLISNLAQASIHDVYIRPATRGYEKIGTGNIGSCTQVTVTLPGARTPTLYFTDAYGQSWELAYGGYLHPWPDPAAILVYLPLGSEIAPAGSSLAALSMKVAHNVPGCS
jgi:hypothetical protein